MIKRYDHVFVCFQTIVKKTRAIFNKLTPENFYKLAAKLFEMPLNDKEDRIAAVMSVIFEKAVDEPAFSATYAKMVCNNYNLCNFLLFASTNLVFAMHI